MLTKKEKGKSWLRNIREWANSQYSCCCFLAINILARGALEGEGFRCN